MMTTLHALFECQVAKSPHSLALVDFTDNFNVNKRLTLQDLDTLSTKFANHLIARDCKKGDIITVGMTHSVFLVIALLGVSKVGATFVAVDLNWPENRKKLVVSESNSRLIVAADGVFESLFVDTDVCRIDQLDFSKFNSSLDKSITVDPKSAAYVIYTSGSTGPPKGVLGSHNGLVNRIHCFWKSFPYDTSEHCCAKTTLGFVDFLTEIFTPLCAGIPLYLFGDRVAKNPTMLIQLVARHQITRLSVVPSLLHSLLQLPSIDQLRCVRVWDIGGEAVTTLLARSFYIRFPEAILINVYGSSEVAADATFHLITDQDLHSTAEPTVPIGLPITNMKCYILDEQFKSVQPGQKGTLYVGGVGVSLGYLNRPEITSKSFIVNPFEEDRELYPVLYCMGDIASVDVKRQGVLRYHGRADYQVKVNGKRFELGEIEGSLRKVDSSISSCVVKYWPLSQSHGLLVAYLVRSSPSNTSEVYWRSHLAQELPSYMIPNQFVVLESMPLNSNGKVDRKQLTMPTIQPKESVLLDSESECIVSLVQQLIGTEIPVALSTELVHIGINSLLMVQLQALVSKEMNVEVTMQELIRCGTISDVCQTIRSNVRRGKEVSGSIIPMVASQSVAKFESPVKNISIQALSENVSLSDSTPFVDVNTGIVYSLLKKEHIADVTALSNRMFCEFEPLTCHVGGTPFDFETIYRRHIVDAALYGKLSVVASKDQQLIGVTVAVDSYRCQMLEDETYESSIALSQRPVLELLNSLHNKNSLDVIKPNESVKALFTAVDSDFMNYGLSYTLEKLSAALATQQGFRSIVTEITNTLSQTTASELGYELSPKLLYRDYKNSNNQRPFEELMGGAQVGTLRLSSLDGRSPLTSSFVGRGSQQHSPFQGNHVLNAKRNYGTIKSKVILNIARRFF